MGFTNDFVQPLLSMESYPDFILALVLPFGLIFNLPLILFILAKMDIVSSAALSAKRK